MKLRDGVARTSSHTCCAVNPLGSKSLSPFLRRVSMSVISKESITIASLLKDAMMSSWIRTPNAPQFVEGGMYGTPQMYSAPLLIISHRHRCIVWRMDDGIRIVPQGALCPQRSLDLACPHVYAEILL